ncbi:non-ribosomal peptide synthetase/MFS transporter [Dactylosporangium darangshiense]|uniref:non-ribosomal peptide synthetase/MFS transporter n=1 Tax=Dactylosporangium darangshiense TaxID=579108 RepID=UPI0036291CBA
MSPTGSALAKRWKRTADDTPAAIERRPDGAPVPLSFAQERLWFLDRYSPGTTAYTVWLAVHAETVLEPVPLRAALAGLVARHESLRMRFPAGRDGAPEVLIDAHGDARLALADADDLAAARARVEELVAVPFDLAAGPVWRALLVRVGGPEPSSVFCLAAHHIAVDGWSTEIVRRELLELYAAARDGAPPPVAGSPIDFGDVAHWQRERHAGAASEELRYWRERLRDVPAVDLPTDRPYPPVQSSAGATHEFRLDAALTAAVQRTAAAAGATPFMVLLAAFQATLGWYGGQSGFAVGCPIAGRDRPETEGVVGMFVNTLAMRADLSGDPTFAELLARVRGTALEAYAHQDVPFERIVTELQVDRDVRRPPVFQAGFAMQNFAGEVPELDGRPVRILPVPAATTRHELALYVGPDGGELAGRFTYATALFDAATVAGIAERFARLLRLATTDPGARLSTLDLLDDGERERLAEWSGAAAARAPFSPMWTLLSDPLDAWAERTPDAPAVVCGADTLTYAELRARADGLARRLRALGVGPDARVAVCLEPSTDLLVALLGVLRAGGAYVPLDPATPPARLLHLLGDAGAGTLVTGPAIAASVPGYTGHLLTGTQGADGPQPVRACPDDLAYVIYTSGSTGAPKGVAVAHRQVVRYLHGMLERLPIEPGSTFGLLQSLAFDFGVTMVYLALATGGALHLLPRRASGAELAGLIRRHRIDYLKLTPSHFAALATDAGAAALLPRRALLFGGEASAAAWTRELAGLSDTIVMNHYGPTETTVGVTTHLVHPEAAPDGETTPIGRPLPGATVHVLDRWMRPRPPGAIGELYLGGDRLARGYLGRPAQTARAFVPDPFGPPGSRLYRTGDLARLLPDGSVQFLGRRDDQVKVRGYRVEPGEIEAALGGCPGVARAVVLLRTGRLVAYLEGAGDTAQVKRRLAETLPDYMVPARFVWLDRLPLQAHGKVDRAALPEPEEGPAEGGFEAPDGPVEEAIAAVWAEVLGAEHVGAGGDFFGLGGHSLLALTAVSRLRRRLPDGVRAATVLELFQHPTVRGLAEALGRADEPRGLLHELTAVEPGRRRSSLVCVPYGGASPVVYRPLADALPEGHALYAVAVPGHDVGEVGAEPQEPLALEALAEACAEEIRRRVDGPIVVYGHCGPGGALAVEIALRLEAAGRPVTALYLGGIFPYGRPGGPLGRLARRLRLERARSDNVYATWLQAMGGGVGKLDEAERRFVIRAMRRDGELAEAYFSELIERRDRTTTLSAPVISVVGERDPGTEYYQERYREWGFLSPRTSLVVLDEAGHYFLRYRAEELAQIVTRVHPALVTKDTSQLPAPGDEGATWWLQAGPAAEPENPAPKPSMRRFLAVAAGQLVTQTGTALTEFAIPIWAYVGTGSLLRFALFAVVAVLPGILVAPLAGAVVDRGDRRRILIAASGAAGGVQAVLAVLALTDRMYAPALYGLLCALSVALTFQRLSYASAVPQLVPKHYLGHANGVVQAAAGVAQFLVPLAAVGLLALVGIAGILEIDVASYAVAIAVLLAVKFPATMAWRRREPLGAEIRNGFRYFWRRPGLRAMLLFYVSINGFLAAALVLVSPLVLTIGSVADAGRIAMVSGAGAIAGGVLMSLWGGPSRHRMRGMLLSVVGFAGAAAVVGARPDLLTIAVGVFGLSFALVLMNGIWMTIVHTKTPQRYHARVIALNQMVALTVLSAGFLLAPLAGGALEPLLRPGGALAGTAGAIIGVGPGRGIALLYLVCAVLLAAFAGVALRATRLSTFDRDEPDAEPDDVVGLAALAGRAPAADQEASR